MICAWCDKPGTGEFEALVASNRGVRFTVNVHKRPCRKRWLEDAAQHGTKESA